jgi:hypothetical protein
MNKKSEQLQKACQAALTAFNKINKEAYNDIRSKLEFVIGSYEYDKNPVGLIEFGEKALIILKDIKAKSPRKVTKKVIDDLEKNLK